MYLSCSSEHTGPSRNKSHMDNLLMFDEKSSFLSVSSLCQIVWLLYVYPPSLIAEIVTKAVGTLLLSHHDNSPSY